VTAKTVETDGTGSMARMAYQLLGRPDPRATKVYAGSRENREFRVSQAKTAHPANVGKRVSAGRSAWKVRKVRKESQGLQEKTARLEWMVMLVRRVSLGSAVSKGLQANCRF
jgi:hypothetical protein